MKVFSFSLNNSLSGKRLGVQLFPFAFSSTRQCLGTDTSINDLMVARRGSLRPSGSAPCAVLWAHHLFPVHCCSHCWLLQLMNLWSILLAWSGPYGCPLLPQLYLDSYCYDRLLWLSVVFSFCSYFSPLFLSPSSLPSFISLSLPSVFPSTNIYWVSTMCKSTWNPWITLRSLLSWSLHF